MNKDEDPWEFPSRIARVRDTTTRPTYPRGAHLIWVKISRDADF